MPSRTKSLAAVATGLCLLLTPPVAVAQISEAQRGELEALIRDYILRNPEIVQEAMTKVEQRKQQAEQQRRKAALAEHAQLIFNSPRQVTLGNPKGDITLVEFFDYNCGYCKRALNDMVELLKTEPGVRVVLKELPVLGANSTEAAKVAVAVQLQDPTGARYLDLHKRLLTSQGTIDRARATALAKEVGADMERLEKDLAGHPEIAATLDESRKIATALGIRGTPSYVVGEEVVPGAIGLAGLKDKLQKLQKLKK